MQLILTGVNIGQPRELVTSNGNTTTGIFKEATHKPVFISTMGPTDDFIADLENHGGPDQAVYLYSREDYNWWEAELDRDLPNGMFGENLTLSSFGTAEIHIGDRFQINDLVLELTFARIPCAKFAAKMGDPEFVKRFGQAGRPGAYARVIQPGTVTAGDPVQYLATGAAYPTVAELYALYMSRVRPVTQLQRGLEAPIGERARLAFEYWLDKAL